MDNRYGRRAPSGGRQRVDDAWPDLEPAAADFGDDPWAWAAREADEVERVDVSGLKVTAVLVCHDAARWLPATLNGLAHLDPAPQRLVAIDNGAPTPPATSYSTHWTRGSSTRSTRANGLGGSARRSARPSGRIGWP